METYPCTHGLFFFALIVGGGKKKAKRYNKKGSVYLNLFFKKKIIFRKSKYKLNINAFFKLQLLYYCYLF